MLSDKVSHGYKRVPWQVPPGLWTTLKVSNEINLATRKHLIRYILVILILVILVIRNHNHISSDVINRFMSFCYLPDIIDIL